MATMLFDRQYADWRELRAVHRAGRPQGTSPVGIADSRDIMAAAPRSGQHEQVESRLERVLRDATNFTRSDAQAPYHRHGHRFQGTHGAQVVATAPPQEAPHRAGLTAPTLSERLRTAGGVAALFGADPKTVTRWASAGRINSIRTPGGARRFRETEVRAVLASLTSPAPLD